MARSASDIESEITETRTALTAALKAQSYGIAGRSVSRAQVSSLQSRLDDLYRQLSRANHGAVRRGVIAGVGGSW
jgi:hypothetical protein